MTRCPLRLSLLILSGACSVEAPSPIDTKPPKTDAPSAHATETPAPEAVGEALIPPPPRRSIEGVHGFTARSAVEFQARPGSPHRLSATYTFPDRARWHIEPANAATGQRTVIYRSGPQAWLLSPGAGETARFRGQQETQVHLQLELRRAALFWPRGIAWEDGLVEGQGVPVRTAEIETGGLLGARFRSPDSPPSSFFSKLPNGDLFEELRDVEWTEGSMGLRPARWALFSEGRKVWTETIEHVHTNVRYVDGHFLPPHLRKLPSKGDGNSILLGEVPARIRRRYDLSASTWEEALAEAKRIIASTRELELSGVVDLNPVFELDNEALPRALFVRLLLSQDEVPDGWEEAAGESALSLLIPDGRLPSPGEVDHLTAACPEGARTGVPRLRLGLVKGEISTAQLLVPLTPSASGH